MSFGSILGQEHLTLKVVAVIAWTCYCIEFEVKNGLLQAISNCFRPCTPQNENFEGSTSWKDRD